MHTCAHTGVRPDRTFASDSFSRVAGFARSERPTSRELVTGSPFVTHLAVFPRDVHSRSTNEWTDLSKFPPFVCRANGFRRNRFVEKKRTCELLTANCREENREIGALAEIFICDEIARYAKRKNQHARRVGEGKKEIDRAVSALLFGATLERAISTFLSNI